MKKLLIILLVVFVVIISLFFYNFLSARNSYNLPSYALKDARIKEAYLFAIQNPASLEGINCHCGCMKSLGHEDLKDCFINKDGSYNEHASGCSECINDALQAIKLINEGKTKEEINKIIGAGYN